MWVPGGDGEAVSSTSTTSGEAILTCVPTSAAEFSEADAATGEGKVWGRSLEEGLPSLVEVEELEYF